MMMMLLNWDELMSKVTKRFAGDDGDIVWVVWV